MDVDGELLRVERERTRVQAEEISRLRLENTQLRAQVGALNQRLISVHSWMARVGQHNPVAGQQQPAWASIAHTPSSSTMMSGPMSRPMLAAPKAVTRRPSGSSSASTKKMDLDPFSALYAAAAAGSRPEEETEKASLDAAPQQPVAIVESTVVECPPTTDDLLFLSGGTALPPSPALLPAPSPAPQLQLQPASTFELFDGGGDDDFDEEDDDDVFNPPPVPAVETAPTEASEHAPDKQQAIKEDDDEARRARKAERRRKKEDREKKLERRRKRAEERRVADERAASRDPNAYSSYYSRGSLEASNDKWRGIGSNDMRVAEIDSVRGLGSGKYRGFGNPYFEQQDNQDDEQGAIAKVGGAALDLLSSAKDLVISNFAKSSSHSEITGSALRTYS